MAHNGVSTSKTFIEPTKHMGARAGKVQALPSVRAQSNRWVGMQLLIIKQGRPGKSPQFPGILTLTAVDSLSRECPLSISEFLKFTR